MMKNDNVFIFKLALSIITIFEIDKALSDPQCVNEFGHAVDWYVLYKFPKIKEHSNVNITNGVSYMFISSESNHRANAWEFSNYSINDSDSFPGKTLALLYTSKDSRNEIDHDVFYLIYNDQPPNKPFTTEYGHAKGILIGNQDKGVWIIHSIPRFPDIKEEIGYFYPSTAEMYGQSFLCITLDAKTMDNIGNQLIINNVNVYESYFSEFMKSKYPNLFRVSKMPKPNIRKHKELFFSVGNQRFISFAKSKLFGDDIYSQWLSSALKIELYVESWLHEDRLPSVCNNTFETHNIQNVSIKLNKTDIQFSNFKDHSKWAVSANIHKPWICIGDINRALSQFIRGGGTVCMKNFNLWFSYFHIIGEVEPCPK